MARQSYKFAPQVMFVPETNTDKHALRLIEFIQDQVRATMQTERNEQVSIGISEIGDDCLKCVARKLAEIPEPREHPDQSGWKAQVGTFVHAGLEDHFSSKRVQDAAVRQGYQLITEETLHLHSYKGLELGGHCDLYAQIGDTTGVVIDWKILGNNTLTHEPSNKYQIQMSGYGLAWQQIGKPVTHTLLYRLPRDGELGQATPVLYRFNPQLAIDRLALLERLIDAAEIIGWDSVIAAQPRAASCFSCPRYERGENQAFLDSFGE